MGASSVGVPGHPKWLAIACMAMNSRVDPAVIWGPLSVTGPRIDPRPLPDASRLDKHAYVPDLHRRFAAADLAVVQGGLTTTMELTDLGVPFLYVPLIDHFEQQMHVRHRLQRYHAGTAVDYTTTSAEPLADLITTTVGTPTSYRHVATDGAQRTAHKLAQLL